jgi:hypothetical protein
VSGNKSEPNRGINDFWLVRLSATGTKLWDHTYGTAGSDIGQSLTRLANGELLLAGSTSASTLNGYSANGDRTQDIPGLVISGWTVRVDSAGTKLSDCATTGFVDEIQQAVLRTRDGGILSVGSGLSDAGYDRDDMYEGDLDGYWLLKRDSLGVALWDTTLVLAGRGQVQPVAKELSNGHLLISGTARLSNPYGRVSISSPPYGIDADLVVYELDARGRTAAYVNKLS